MASGLKYIKMPRLFSSGNYAYVITRVKVRRTKLLPKETYQRLLLMELPEIQRFISETEYRQDVEELITRYHDVDLIENALNRNLARNSHEVLGFAKGDLRDMIEAYLTKWDVANIKTILRGLSYGAPPKEIFESIIPAGAYSREFWESLARLESLDDVLKGLKETPYHSTLTMAWPTYEETRMLTNVENALDRFLHKQLLNSVSPTSKGNKIFLRAIHRQIDILNLLTILRFRHTGIPPGPEADFIIPGGEILVGKELEKLKNAETMEELLAEIKTLPYGKALGEIESDIERTHSLSLLAGALERYHHKETTRHSYLYPVSIIPVFDFLQRKDIEVRNLRILVRGKESGLSDDTLEKLLIV